MTDEPQFLGRFKTLGGGVDDDFEIAFVDGKHIAVEEQVTDRRVRPDTQRVTAVLREQAPLPLLEEADRAVQALAHAEEEATAEAEATVASAITEQTPGVVDDTATGDQACLWTPIVQAASCAHEVLVYDNSSTARPFRVVAHQLSNRWVSTPALPHWSPTAMLEWTARCSVLAHRR